MKLLFWISAGLVLYTYAGYPLLLAAAASLRQAWEDLRFAVRRRDRRRRPAGQSWPSVSLVLSAYNEEAAMVEKMRNLAALDYPPERLEILVGCDGCTDRTAELARAANLSNTRIFDFSERSGKPEVLNRLVREASGEIVVFSDANTFLDPGAVRSMAFRFSDPRVGCVCGELRLTSRRSVSQPEGLYWRYEVFLKFLESRLGLLLGANGGVYAIRRELFSPLPRQGVSDDFLVPMRIRGAGYRVIYDPEALACEEAGAGLRHDFRRRIRVGAGNFATLRYTARLLSPAAGRLAFSYWSHKVFRWLAPFALPLAFFCSLALAERPFYAACAAVGTTLAALALVGYRLESRNAHHALFSVPCYFIFMNLAMMLGLVRFLTGGHRAAWYRAARSEQGSPKGLNGAGSEVGSEAAHLRAKPISNRGDALPAEQSVRVAASPRAAGSSAP